MPKMKKPVLDYYLGTCKEMQAWPVIYPDALYLMLSEQINRVGPGNDYEPRVMSSFGERSYVVKVVNGKLSLVMSASWDYLDTTSSTPNLGELRKLVDGIRIEQVFSKSNNKKFSITAVVDLIRWKNLAQGIGHAHILSYVGHEHSTPLPVSQIKQELTLILNTHYPHVALDYLLLAADVGETPEEAEEFIRWLGDIKTRVYTLNKNMPENF